MRILLILLLLTPTLASAYEYASDRERVQPIGIEVPRSRERQPLWDFDAIERNEQLHEQNRLINEQNRILRRMERKETQRWCASLDPTYGRPIECF